MARKTWLEILQEVEKEQEKKNPNQAKKTTINPNTFQTYKALSSIATPTELENKKTTTSKSNDKAWYNQFFQEAQGNVLQKIGGTAADVILNTGKGITGVVEGITDLAMYSNSLKNKVAGTALNVIKQGTDSLFGEDNVASKAVNFLEENQKTQENFWKDTAKKNWTDKLFEEPTEFYNQYSVLGDTSDKVFSGVGQTLAYATGGGLLGKAGEVTLNIGKQALKIPTLVFASATGSSMSETYNKSEDVKDWQAWAKGVGSGAIEGVAEGLFGVLGVGGSSLDDAITGKAMSAFKTGFGKAMANMGVQAVGEGTEEIVSYVGNYILDHGMDLMSKAVGDTDVKFNEGWNSADMWESFTTAALSSILTGGMGTTINIKEAQNISVNEAEKQLGRKLTTEEAKNVKKQTTLQLMQAQQNEMLGKNNQEQQIAPINENVEKTDVTDLNLNQQNNVSNEILPTNTQNVLNTTTTPNMAISQNMAQNLAQNENISQNQAENTQKIDETELKKKNFTYQAQETDSQYKKSVYESASQVMNDTEASHKFADVVAKIAEERKTTYKFTNDKQLKELGYNVKDATINGLVNENGEVLINVDSAKALNSVVGHETTHLLESTKEYDALKQMAIEYAKTNGDYQSRLDTLTKLYEGKNADVEAELTSDIVGDYLFTNEQFIKDLSVQKPTLFQKIKNLISDLVVKFKGTTQEKQLRELQRKFEKAYRANTEANTNTKYSLNEDHKQQQLDIIQKNNAMTDDYHVGIRTIEDIKTWEEAMQDDESFVYGDFDMKDAERALEKGTIMVYSSKPIQQGGFVSTSKNMAKDYAGNGKIYSQEVNINDVAWINGDEGQYAALTNTNTKYSLTDNEGRELSKEQQEFFKNSKVRDRYDNTLLTLYHGTNTDITEFDTNKSTYARYGSGSYFTDSYGMAEEFANERAEEEGTTTTKINEVYLNIEKLFDNTTDLMENTPEKAKLFELLKEKGVNDRQLENIEKSELDTPFELISRYITDNNIKDNWVKANDTNKLLREAGYEGIKGYAGDGVYEYVAFEPNQIKNVDNTNPTTNPDIRKSLSAENEQLAPMGDYNVYGNDVKLQVQEAIAPLQEQVQKLTNMLENPIPTSQDITETQADTTLNQLANEDRTPLDTDFGDIDMEDIMQDYGKETEVQSPFDEKDIKEVGKRNVKAYMYENPEVKPYFQEEAQYMLYDLKNSVKGERIYNAEQAYKEGIADQNGAYGWTGIKRQTTEDIAYLLDNFSYSYADIEKGLNNIIEDNGKENNAVSKRIEFMLDERLRNGYEAADGTPMQANQDYIKLLEEKAITEYNSNRFKDMTDEELLQTINGVAEETTPVKEQYEAIEPTKGPKMIRIAPEKQAVVEQAKPSEIEKPIEAPIAEEVTLKEAQQGNTIYDDMIDNVLGKVANNVAQIEASNYENTTNAAPVNNAKAKRTIAEKVRSAVNTFQDTMVNRSRAIDQLAKQTNNKEIKFKNDRLNNVMAEIGGEIELAQTDLEGHKIGKSVKEIFAPSKKAGLEADFNNYLINVANIERSQRGKGLAGIDFKQSQDIVNAYETSHPEFIHWKNDVIQYSKNALLNDVKSGLVSQELADKLMQMYPSYMPYKFDIENIYTLSADEIKAGKTIKTAVGGGNIAKLNTIEEAIIKQTVSRKIAQAKNGLLSEIVNTIENKTEVPLVNTTAQELGNVLFEEEATGKKFATAYIDGNMVTAEISNDVYNALNNGLEKQIKELEDKFELITKPLQTATTIFGKMNTTWNVTFPITNFLKDLQDAPLNSKHTTRFIKNIATGKTIKAMATNSAEWQQFKSLYGTDTLQQEYGGSNKTEGIGKNIKFLNKIGAINQFTEMLPRFAEFQASLESGESVTEALYNAREVTTNFGRGGTIAKAINRNGASFFNVSIQGFDKLIRNFSGENGAKGVVQSLAKVAMLGILPAVFNHMVFGDDDEEYEELSTYIKDNYYLIKLGDGSFFRIPKGRMVSIFGSAARRTLEAMEGKENAFEGYLQNAWSQVGFNNPIEDNIFAGLIDVANNETWYGDDLVPTRLQNLPDAEQYDESTDDFSKWLGEQLNVSPYKVNYLLNQYGGSAADILLPMFTQETQTGNDGLMETIGGTFKDKFTTSSTFKNQNVSDFYSAKEEMQKLANSQKATDDDVLTSKYLNSVSSDLSELYKEKREIQSNEYLSNSQKYARVEEIQREIDDIAKEALQEYKNINKTSTYAVVGDTEYYKKNDTWKKVEDEDADDLNGMGLSIVEKSNYYRAKNEISTIKSNGNYEKADITSVISSSNLTDEAKTYLYNKNYKDYDMASKIGIDIDSWLTYSSTTYTADKDSEGKSISGSRKAKVLEAINNLDLDYEQRAILFVKEYSSEADNYMADIVEYLNNNDNISYDDEIEILTGLGAKVDANGNVSW